MRAVHNTVNKPRRPVKILQYGEGNFLRAFVDYMVDAANEAGVFDGGVCIVKPITYGRLDAFREQDCVYTVLLRGITDGVSATEKRVVTSVNSALDAYADYAAYAALAALPELRFVVSNTTEAGIVYDKTDDIDRTPPASYPGKLTKFLYERYLAFDGADDRGLIILPVELIEKNGSTLKDCCLKLADLWKLPGGFKRWMNECNIFCNTLVDRIVTGYPAGEAAALEKELGYSDKLLAAGEPFALWVIESDRPAAVARELPLDKAGLPVMFVNDYVPYRERKVRLLNGAHTAVVPAAYLAGLETVGGMMKDAAFRAFLERVLFDELVPLTPLPREEAETFARSVIERFENPFIKHQLLSITLNSVSKFKARVLPTIKETYIKTGVLPSGLVFSLAALAALYTTGDERVRDDGAVLEFFAERRHSPPEELMEALLKRADFWGGDLNAVTGLRAMAAGYLGSMRANGARRAAEMFLQ